MPPVVLLIARHVATHLGGWLLGVALSVLCLWLLKAPAEEAILGLFDRSRPVPITQAAREEARRTASKPEWRQADSAEFSWLLDVYGAQADNEGKPLSYDRQPFKVREFPEGPDDREAKGYLVFWPRICSASGCRVDVLSYGRDTVVGSVYAANVRPTRAVHNGRPVLVEALGRAVYWNGTNYVVDGAP